MLILNTLGGSGLVASAALTTLSGWSGVGLPAPLPAAHRWPAVAPSRQTSRPIRTASFMSPDAIGKPLIFVSDGYATVNIYLQAGKHRQVGWITGFSYPAGLATDVAGNLYIANAAIFSGTPSVLVYAPPYTNGPMLSLQNGSPFGVSVSPQGVVAVTGCTNSSPSCGLGVAFYAAGSAVPCAALVTYPAMTPAYDAFDAKGNLYIGGSNASNGGLVAEIDGGCNAKNVTPLVTGNTIGLAGGIQVDKAHRIAILDASSNAVIDTYLHPRDGSLGNPVSTTPLTSSPSAFIFTFLESGRGIWVADVNGRASKYSYPTGGLSEQTIVGGGFPSGIAVTPPLLP